MGVVTVGKVQDFRDGEGRRVVAGGRELAVFRFGTQFHAVSAVCTHALADLSEGSVDRVRLTVECPLHGAEFDLRTGEALSPPAALPLEVFEVRVEGEEVRVDLAGRRRG
ncbi:MAG TPA: non-heme iron oxygenase ferredoxin subunit [Thermoanaerobaculaceae bacterium]|nr:non-heme iron oxygenase ferredoxin subunit [Thermoanaerobaculaceae bacterium]HRS15025.1 non-heme iron oxygenase ferredoxin subunit [Thermoanaerobaculaceae bacterium]